MLLVKNKLHRVFQSAFTIQHVLCLLFSCGYDQFLCVLFQCQSKFQVCRTPGLILIPPPPSHIFSFFGVGGAKGGYCISVIKSVFCCFFSLLFLNGCAVCLSEICICIYFAFHYLNQCALYLNILSILLYVEMLYVFKKYCFNDDWFLSGFYCHCLCL